MLKKVVLLLLFTILVCLSGCEKKVVESTPISYDMPKIKIEFCGEKSACVLKEVHMKLPIDTYDKAMFILEQLNKTYYTQEREDEIYRLTNRSKNIEKDVKWVSKNYAKASIPNNTSRYCFFNDGESCWSYLERAKLENLGQIGNNYWITGEIDVETGKIKEVSNYS